MKYRNYILVAAMMLVATVAEAAKTVSSTALKLVADGQTVNTPAIQRAIDNLSRKGGGTIVFEPGNYVIGTLELRSNIELHLKSGATLLGSTNPYDYIDITKEVMSM